MSLSSPARGISGALLLFVTLSFGALASAYPAAPLASEIIRLPGHCPALGFVARETGAVAPAEPVQLALALPLRRQPELDALLARLYDPNDPLYGQFLTPEEFAARFAPTEQQYAAVAAFARQQG